MSFIPATHELMLCRYGNVKLRNVNVRGSEKVGALVGTLGNGSVSNSSVSGGTVTGVVVGTGHEATGGVNVGGLVGDSGGPISDSSAAVTVSGQYSVGGWSGRATIRSPVATPAEMSPVRMTSAGWWDGTMTILTAATLRVT